MTYLRIRQTIMNVFIAIKVCHSYAELQTLISITAHELVDDKLMSKRNKADHDLKGYHLIST